MMIFCLGAMVGVFGIETFSVLWMHSLKGPSEVLGAREVLS